MSNYDLRYVQEALPHLKDYLLSNELFWPAPANNERGEQAYPSLTLGNLLYHLHAASARNPGVGSTETELRAGLKEWQTHTHHKLKNEYSSRLRQWLAYLNELQNDPRDQAAAFGSQVRLRVLLALIEAELKTNLPPDAALLPAADARLKSHFESGDFLWEPDLQPAFPKKEFWYLYGKIKLRNSRK